MKIHRIALLFVFVLGTLVGYSQSAAQNSGTANKQEIKEAVNLNDGYYGLKKKILVRMVNATMPADCPTYKQGQSEQEYKNALWLWAKDNIQLFKPEYHEKIKAYNASSTSNQ